MHPKHDIDFHDHRDLAGARPLEGAALRGVLGGQAQAQPTFQGNLIELRDTVQVIAEGPSSTAISNKSLTNIQQKFSQKISSFSLGLSL